MIVAVALEIVHGLMIHSDIQGSTFTPHFVTDEPV